ncbi:MAG: SHOCT domain-containing protein [Deltaproteobacteria bacterium]|nr:SHOCT domain-containing protein [Deltaproteobacteria bacterium]MBI3390634.1 SHOCT domain-containing protein [Deltaproteobacteria bacterium]
MRDMITSGVFLAVVAVHFSLQWYGWKLHIHEAPFSVQALEATGDSLWDLCSLPLFALISRRLQNLYFTEVLLANSALWGIAGAWSAYVLLRLTKIGKRRARRLPVPVTKSEPVRIGADRLLELKKLRDQGLITTEEFQRKRETILTHV